MLLPITLSRQILLPLPLILETLKALAEENLASVYSGVYMPLTSGHIIPVITTTPESITDWLFVLYTAFVCGAFRPVLALPADKEIDDKVLLHELLHLNHLDALHKSLKESISGDAIQ